MTVDTVVVHYSATYPDQNISRNTVDGWHRQEGFREIGYHWFIRRDGTLEEGRTEGTMGAGVRGHNGRNYIHVCWAGGLERASGRNKGVWNPTEKQEECLVQLIKDIQKRHPSATNVVGHIDLAPSQCPGLPKGGVANWWTNKQKEKAAPVFSEEQQNWLASFIKQLLGKK